MGMNPGSPMDDIFCRQHTLSARTRESDGFAPQARYDEREPGKM